MARRPKKHDQPSLVDQLEGLALDAEVDRQLDRLVEDLTARRRRRVLERQTLLRLVRGLTPVHRLESPFGDPQRVVQLIDRIDGLAFESVSQFEAER